MLSRTFLWPQGYTSAAMISVNLDAEFYGRIFYPGIDVSEGDIQRLGWTGMEYGLPHLLDCFREHGVKGTFFIPGRVAELYPDAVRAIADAGHELGCHGYEHEILAHFTPEEQLELLKKAKAAIEKAAGQRKRALPIPAPCPTRMFPTSVSRRGCRSFLSRGRCLTFRISPLRSIPPFRRARPAAPEWIRCWITGCVS